MSDLTEKLKRLVEFDMDVAYKTGVSTGLSGEGNVNRFINGCMFENARLKPIFLDFIKAYDRLLAEAKHLRDCLEPFVRHCDETGGNVAFYAVRRFDAAVKSLE